MYASIQSQNEIKSAEVKLQVTKNKWEHRCKFSFIYFHGRCWFFTLHSIQVVNCRLNYIILQYFLKDKMKEIPV